MKKMIVIYEEDDNIVHKKRNENTNFTRLKSS